MILPIQLSDSHGRQARRARLEAIHFSPGRILNRIVASLLATTANAILRSRGGIFPAVPREAASGKIAPRMTSILSGDSADAAPVIITSVIRASKIMGFVIW
jgi:hypothetical protein